MWCTTEIVQTGSSGPGWEVRKAILGKNQVTKDLKDKQQLTRLGERGMFLVKKTVCVKVLGWEGEIKLAQNQRQGARQQHQDLRTQQKAYPIYTLSLLSNCLEQD